MSLKKIISSALAGAVVYGSTVVPVFAKPPGAQVFEIYDDTQDGLQVGTDPDTGNVQANANPGGKSRLIIEVHLQKGAPNCTYDVELVRDSLALNGGLTTTGHSGPIDVLGTLTTNGVGNGNAHFDVDPQLLPDSVDATPGVLDSDVYAHIDVEDPSGKCVEADGTFVVTNEYGAAPDPALGTPLTWKE